MSIVNVVINFLLLRPRKSSLSYASDDDEDVSEEADEVVPDGVEEVELARISLEQAERERKLLLDDIRTLSFSGGSRGQLNLLPDKPGGLWMISHGKSTLVRLKLQCIIIVFSCLIYGCLVHPKKSQRMLVYFLSA